MKKAKFLGLALAAAITLTGAGYAYWNDSVTINSTVRTGIVNTMFNKTAATENLAFQNANDPAYGTVVYSADTNGNADRVATIDVHNLYPGATTTKTLTIHNTSTIPLKVASLNFVSSPKTDNVQVNASVAVGTGAARDLGNLINSIDYAGGVSNYLIPANTDITITFTITVPTTTQDSENGTFTFSVSPQFTQFNQ